MNWRISPLEELFRREKHPLDNWHVHSTFTFIWKRQVIKNPRHTPDIFDYRRMRDKARKHLFVINFLKARVFWLSHSNLLLLAS